MRLWSTTNGDTLDMPATTGARTSRWGRGPISLLLLLACGLLALVAIIQADRDHSAEIAGLALSPPYVVENAVTFSAGFDTIKLNAVEAPPWYAVCRDTSGRRWACGLRARDALVLRIKDRPVTCHHARPSAERILEATCVAAGRDLAAMLVTEGWARPATRDVYRPEAIDARQNHRGLWGTDEWGS
jgi:endonuclease YncB( thermonuclease family)